MSLINFKSVLDILSMVEYFIETDREIEHVNVCDTWFYWLSEYLNTNKSKFTIISKRPDSILAEKEGVVVLFKNEKWISNPTHKIEMTKIETINDTFYIKDFYIKLK